MKLTCGLISGLLLGVFASSAHAGTITTGALPTGNGTRVSCRFVNAGRADATNVTLEVVSYFGIVQATSTFPSVPAGTTVSASDTTPTTINFCRVSGKGVSKGRSHLTICVVDSGSTPIACLDFP